MTRDKNQYEPGDSRRVTLTKSDLDIEPTRTGPLEDEARELADDRQTAKRREPTAEELRTGG
ncbi:hypothetical protein [Erythrobacter litoralis]|uniref:Uncharacterized protein n=1 Tax=Erythrobacter litoralis (strain HTCC2594) TaxID=314225 RepID=Q2N7C8_ERYLH|nr:hypothetical protein [Erythrobacter litoralis]ABC64413.1 hypothetical protein ELI_11605 [Erythrobacter litoralis HTCC2594]